MRARTPIKLFRLPRVFSQARVFFLSFSPSPLFAVCVIVENDSETDSAFFGNINSAAANHDREISPRPDCAIELARRVERDIVSRAREKDLARAKIPCRDTRRGAPLEISQAPINAQRGAFKADSGDER